MAKKTKKPLTLFFLNGELHRKLNINRGRDLIVTWNYPQAKKITYSYSDVLRRKKPSFSTREVAKILNRSRISLEIAIRGGMIEEPPYTYTLDENRRKWAWAWREEDILDALDYFASVHRGRPRNDGQQTAASNLPTPREVRAMINNAEILYVKQGDMFVPTWRAKEFL